MNSKSREQVIEEITEDKLVIIGPDYHIKSCMKMDSYYGDYSMEKEWIARMIFEYGL